MVFVVIVCDKRRHGPIFCLIGSARLLIDKWLDVNIATLDTLGRNSAARRQHRSAADTSDILRADGGYVRGHVHLHTLHCHRSRSCQIAEVHSPQASTIQMLEGGLSSLSSLSVSWSNNIARLGRLWGREMDLGGHCDVT